MEHIRTVITGEDILYIEVECPSCKAITVIPFIDYRNQVAQTILSTTLSQCLWCNNPWVTPHKNIIQQLINTLLSLRGDGAPPIRLVLRNAMGKK